MSDLNKSVARSATWTFGTTVTSTRSTTSSIPTIAHDVAIALWHRGLQH